MLWTDVSKSHIQALHIEGRMKRLQLEEETKVWYSWWKCTSEEKTCAQGYKNLVVFNVAGKALRCIFNECHENDETEAYCQATMTDWLSIFSEFHHTDSGVCPCPSVYFDTKNGREGLVTTILPLVHFKPLMCSTLKQLRKYLQPAPHRNSLTAMIHEPKI